MRLPGLGPLALGPWVALLPAQVPLAGLQLAGSLQVPWLLAWLLPLPLAWPWLWPPMTITLVARHPPQVPLPPDKRA